MAVLSVCFGEFMRNFVKRHDFLVLPAVPFLFLLFSCEFFTVDVKDYLKDNTENAAIMKYEIISGTCQTDPSGRINVSSESDVSVRLMMRNPQRFAFLPSSNMFLELQNLDDDSVMSEFSAKPDRSLVLLEQSASDYSDLILTYPSGFLVSVETGFDISPQIRLRHPVSAADFGAYDGLKIVCNSPPPPIYGAVVYVDSSSQPNKYVVLFNMPSKSLLSGIHRDISSIKINGAEYDVTVNSDDGTFAFGGDAFRIGDYSSDSSGYSKLSAEFKVSGQPAIFETGDILSDELKQYSIALTDRNGLSTEIVTSSKSVRLDDVVLTDLDGNVINSGDSVGQDEGSSYATITFTPAVTVTNPDTGAVEDTSDSVVVYEVYQGTDDSGKSLYSGRNSGGPLSLKIPAGEVFVRVYSHKDLFADSVPVEYGLRILKSRIYVSPDGSDTDNNGSENSPFATVTKALAEFSDITAGNTVYLTGNISDSPEFTEAGADVTVKGDGNSISGAAVSAPGGNITFDGLNVKGNLTVTGGTLSMQGGSVSGEVALSGGKLLLSDAAVSGAAEYSGGEFVLCGGTAISGGIKISGSGLLIAVKSLTSEKVAEISGVDGWSKGTAVLVSYDGDDAPMGGTVRRFTLDSEKWILTEDSSGSRGVLNSSGGSIAVRNREVTLSLDTNNISPGGKITVSAAVTDRDTGKEIQAESSEFEDWELRIYNHGTDTGAVQSGNTVTVPGADSGWPADTYHLFVSVKYGGTVWSSTFEITVGE